jgi:hypothetical protein
MPECDGCSWPDADAAEALPRQQLEFLSIYYRLNLAYDRLHKLQAAGNAAESAAVAEHLQALIDCRDKLEDRLAPIGFYAEPVISGHFAINLIFHCAHPHVPENHLRYEPFDVCVKVPLPPLENHDRESAPSRVSAEAILADLKLPVRNGKAAA